MKIVLSELEKFKKENMSVQNYSETQTNKGLTLNRDTSTMVEDTDAMPPCKERSQIEDFVDTNIVKFKLRKNVFSSAMVTQKNYKTLEKQNSSRIDQNEEFYSCFWSPQTNENIVSLKLNW